MPIQFKSTFILVGSENHMKTKELNMGGGKNLVNYKMREDQEAVSGLHQH